MAPLKVMMCSSHVFLSNGYSRISYGLLSHLATKKDLELIHWGFQNFNPNPEHIKNRQLPKSVLVYDCYLNENPKQMGFGFDQIADFIDQQKPDVIIIYNDFVVVSNILEKMKSCKHKDYKTIIYIDQVYDTQKKEYIKKPTTFIQTKIIENDIEEWKACDKDFEISNFGNIRKSDTKEIIND